MKVKISFDQALLVLEIVVSSMFFSATLMRLPIHHTYAESSPPIGSAGSAYQLHIQIPAINVDAVVESVGLTPDGAMAATEGPSNAAWFDLGPRPGENGSAVIAGHYGWKDDIPAVFDDLNGLHAGDKIYVEDGGATTTFVVGDIRTYSDTADASAVFASSDGKAHLNLITCGGVWNKARKSYSDRLVVFADKAYE